MDRNYRKLAQVWETRLHWEVYTHPLYTWFLYSHTLPNSMFLPYCWRSSLPSPFSGVSFSAFFLSMVELWILGTQCNHHTWLIAIACQLSIVWCMPGLRIKLIPMTVRCNGFLLLLPSLTLLFSFRAAHNSSSLTNIFHSQALVLVHNVISRCCFGGISLYNSALCRVFLFSCLGLFICSQKSHH